MTAQRERSAERAILLVGHGSRRREANALTAAIAQRLQRRLPRCFVHAAHLELAEPNVEEGIELCVRSGAKEITVQPFLLADGRHSAIDIPAVVTDAMRRHPDITFRLGEVLGDHDLLVDLLLLRAEAAAVARPESK